MIAAMIQSRRLGFFSSQNALTYSMFAIAGVEEFVSSSIPGVQVLRLRAIEDALGGDCDMVILRLVQAHHFRQHLCAKAKIQ